jgi:hypothetical protein
MKWICIFLFLALAWGCTDKSAKDMGSSSDDNNTSGTIGDEVASDSSPTATSDGGDTGQTDDNLGDSGSVDSMDDPDGTDGRGSDTTDSTSDEETESVDDSDSGDTSVRDSETILNDTSRLVDTSLNDSDDLDTHQGTDADSGWPIDAETGKPVGFANSLDWHGCMWTQTDQLNAGTVVTPTDFRNHMNGDPYCIQGKLGAGEDTMAMLGFNISESPEGADCSAGAQRNAPLAPGVLPRANGIGFEIQFNEPAPFFSLELLGQGEGSRWCYPKGQQGAMGDSHFFIYYKSFDSSCVPGESEAPYDFSPISAVVLHLHGEADAVTDFDVCLNRLEESRGMIFDDTPFSPIPSGTIGGEGGDDANYERKKIEMNSRTGPFILQNNFMGGADGRQTLEFDGDRFEIVEFIGAPWSARDPISYPSYYVGQNGSRAVTTAGTDGLPLMLTDIASLEISFRWSEVNAVHDVDFIPTVEMWFSADNLSWEGVEYEGPVDGRVTLWLADPLTIPPFGASDGTVEFCGATWTVWGGSGGGNPWFPSSSSDRPFLTFVADAPVTSLRECDLNDVLRDAFSTPRNGYLIDANWYLTDVFAGLQIWDGNPVGLRVEEFHVAVEN